jgi:hypothetical protein
VDVAQADEQDEGSVAEAIRFPAIVGKVQTLADGGIRLTLDLPETAIPEAAMLMEAKQQGIPLTFEAQVDGNLINKRIKDDGSAKGNHKQSKWQTAEE